MGMAELNTLFVIPLVSLNKDLTFITLSKKKKNLYAFLSAISHRISVWKLPTIASECNKIHEHESQGNDWNGGCGSWCWAWGWRKLVVVVVLWGLLPGHLPSPPFPPLLWVVKRTMTLQGLRGQRWTPFICNPSLVQVL